MLRTIKPCHAIQSARNCFQKPYWFEETYRQIHRRVYWYEENIIDQNAKEMCANTTFGFVAVDDDEGRRIACSAMAEAGIPFIDVGVALNRRDGQVAVQYA